MMCRLLGVKRNGFYRYLKAQQHPRPDDDTRQDIIKWMHKIAKARDYSYGSRRMKKALNCLGYPVGRRFVRTLMKEAGIQVRYRKKYKVTTHSKHNKPVFENVLDRQFDVSAPNQAYVQDITYIWTQEGWLYLAVVIDLFSRRVVGWSMGSRMKAKLVCDALTMAIWQRRPSEGLIMHSDRGSQYASEPYRRLLKGHGFVGSMSRKGDCWDNAVVESFFGSLKQERGHWRHYQTRHEAQQDILDYITVFHNPVRLHSYLDYKSPNQYELDVKNERKVA
jgi:transposase InsO family protein